ncbi:class F sortase [Klenkia taihuensis]|uniref:Sortase family protein n=1 Tax=Klenkia taihuensis TaxID=1225127 RepID=A0A1I1NDI3_9ACTN|nr:class F sortase [Klenkia taihuensis]GHE12022.1 class F sortase [Klenkia taihuensis]SFC95774.1 Sortase family protein [Klenkia taihuensis]
MASPADRAAGSSSGLVVLLVLVTLLAGGWWYGYGRDDTPAVPATSAAEVPLVPAALSVPSIGVQAPVEQRGTVEYTNPFTGQQVAGYGVPEDMAVTSWWSDGPEPGSGQMAVVLGHDVPGDDPGVFDRLAELQVGDPVVLTSADGTELQLQVIEAPLTGLDKSTSDLSDALNGHPEGADVALVTCGGEYDSSAGASEENVVVFASVA